MHTRVVCTCVYMVKKNNRVLKILYTITAWLYKDPTHVKKKTVAIFNDAGVEATV